MYLSDSLSMAEFQGKLLGDFTFNVIKFFTLGALRFGLFLLVVGLFFILRTHAWQETKQKVFSRQIIIVAIIVAIVPFLLSTIYTENSEKSSSPIKSTIPSYIKTEELIPKNVRDLQLEIMDESEIKKQMGRYPTELFGLEEVQVAIANSPDAFVSVSVLKYKSPPTKEEANISDEAQVRQFWKHIKENKRIKENKPRAKISLQKGTLEGWPVLKAQSRDLNLSIYVWHNGLFSFMIVGTSDKGNIALDLTKQMVTNQVKLKK